MSITLFVIWYIIGVASFVYWWTEDYDLTPQVIPLAIIVGFGGILTFLFGMSIHGKQTTIIKSRKNKVDSQL